tara:strand:+ start:6755 stop:6964 length:210 start_codon:yes stop_codon:yes gene_type:complete
MSEPIKILEIVENEDGTAEVSLDISDEFQAWFKKSQDLQRWSPKRFEKWFIEALTKGLMLVNEESDEND